MKKIILIFLLLGILYPLLAQERIIPGQTITKKTTWSGTVIIEGDVTVAKQARLTIEAGTRVLFRAKSDKMNSGKDKTRSELIVYGILMVKGNMEAKVTFSSASASPRMGDWYGVRLMNPRDISVMDHCLIEYGFIGLTIKKSNPVIRNSRMTLNYHAGILAEVKAEPKISKNIISENGYVGVITELGAKPILSDNLIAANQIGIIALSLSQPNLGNINDPKRVNQGRNNIFENSEYDVYNHTNLNLLAENNSWGENNRQSEIAARIYDKNDEAKYGSIDFLPIFQKSSLDEFLPISQAGEPVADQTPVNNAPLSTPLTANLPVQNNSRDSVIQQNNTLANLSNPQLTANEEKTDLDQQATEQKQIDTTPLLASTITPEPEPAKEENTSKTPAINYDQIFLEYFLDQKTAVVKKEVPRITNFTLGRGAKGRIIVRAVVGKSGAVESASVIRGLNPYFDQLSLDAALKFRFTPGSIKGNPVRFYTNLFFDF